MTIETEPRLIEMNFGIYDGEPIETTAFQENRSEISLAVSRRESVLDVAGRIYPLIEEALASEETYLFVCHNAVMRVIDNYFNGKKSKISWTFIVKIHNLYNMENKIKSLIFWLKT